MPNKWEIWYAKVKFEDNPSVVKERPVLVIENRGDYCIVALKITSHEPREGYDNEYGIQQWAEAGLKKTSTIRGTKFLKLTLNDFVNKRGMLQTADILQVMKFLKK